jgi:hypothetical protein
MMFHFQFVKEPGDKPKAALNMGCNSLIQYGLGLEKA